MNDTPRPIREWRGVDRLVFENDIVPLGRPAVLRGIVADWPSVREGAHSPSALCAYLRRFDSGKPVDVLAGRPEIEGRLFYAKDNPRAVNFERRPTPFATLLDGLLALIDAPRPPAVAIQSVPVPDLLPGFVESNALPLLGTQVVPRIWVGNAIKVSAHYDLNANIACVVGGRRRFTLFPPEQIANLYIGPLDFTPAGSPVSMVHVDAPDLERFPRFRAALAVSQSAELGPGDALYIPYFWWHHVASLERFNVLVNYWWNEAPAHLGSPFAALLHALYAVRDLPPEQRAVWRTVFEHYVFEADGDPSAHLAPEARGVLAPMTPASAQEIRAHLLRLLALR
jgi:hypothetical protein